MTVTFELFGQRFIALNGGPQYTFSPATSQFVSCDSQEEVDRYWSRLLEGGKPNQCGWIDDKFGASGQHYLLLRAARLQARLEPQQQAPLPAATRHGVSHTRFRDPQTLSREPQTLSREA